MAHRIEVRAGEGLTTFEFHGLLDPAALRELLASADLAAANAAAIRIVLRAGTEVDRACLPALCALEAEIAAESPYLARWVSDAKRHRGRKG